ncbi:MAG: hypothetical protein DI498_13885 [Paracoccus denitrificans]|nr:MAG: hypothetical protein DI498_13885 [Paracoccus denitrificans]PZO82895.1 MAG: hypothetical protein DI633_13885 [Paracoccus denitrificans]
MARLDDLVIFVRDGLGAGREPEELAGVMRDAGWSDGEIAQALNAWVAVDGGAPVPRPRAYVSAKEALVYGLLFITLGAICCYSVILWFGTVNYLLPEPDQRYGASSSTRFGIATLVATVPVFLWMNARVQAASDADQGQRRSLVRRWFAAVTMLLAVLTLLGDLVAVVYAALNGDVTLRFVTKALVVAVMGVLAFAYYRDELNAT